ncbi:hypothetical protein ASU31_19240 [Pedobacter ginsenosidimutans]|uniref:Acid-shock protein n=1 Tax=Pedobacter ginsenosidimutans TaxID=687842 RepID=A0A0T5VKN9_9SPHI|nr:hypothetical protein [Pedobacter ginsenosidimutans]KRT14430.1 hypothetical protein ASU31_19240 [Pedobacter ginsenosidimutans]
MKKILTLLSALLIVTGLKAQKTAGQKETVKPKADTFAKSSIDKQSNKKEVKITRAIKYAPASKVAPVSTKAVKVAPVN